MGNTMQKQRVEAAAGLRFHPAVRGANLRLDAHRTRATRHKGFCGGLALSARPVSACERVHVRLGRRDPEWQGALRVGFTCRDPDTMELPLPPYALPDLVERRDSWADRVPEEFAVPGAELAFWVQADGSMFCSAWLPHGPHDTGRRTRVWRLKGLVEIQRPLWAIVDVYGATRDVQLLGTTMQPPICSGRSSARATFRIAPKALPAALPPPPPPSPFDATAGGKTAAPGAIAAGADGTAGTHGVPECVVCMQGPRQAAFVACGHFCVCVGCSKRLCECPLCRSPGGKVMRIYYS